MPIHPPIGIQMYTVRELTPTPDAYRDIIRQIAAIGYAGIEAGPPGDMSAADFREFVEGLGMKVCATWGSPSPENIAQLVDQASALGVSFVVSCWGTEHFASLEAVKETAAFFQAGAELLKPHGLELLYHNHWWEFENKIAGRYGWDVLMELAPSLNCEIDLYWASNFGEVDVPAIVRKYATRTPLMHVKDGPLIKGEPNTACGKGKADLVGGIAAGDPERLKWAIVELDDYVGGAANMIEAVRDSYAYLSVVLTR